MAPKKTKLQESIEPSSSPSKKKMKKVVSSSSPALTRSKTQRVTRSSVAGSSTAASLLSLPKKPPTKKLKKSPKKANQKKSEEEVVEEEIVPSNGSSSPPPPPASPIINTRKSKGKSSPISKTVVIEHCKQCNAFKTRANQVKDGLETGVPGIKVVINPDKPRRGCFEIREEGGEIFITLLNMKRPFPALKALEMDEVISDIVEKLT